MRHERFPHDTCATCSRYDPSTGQCNGGLYDTITVGPRHHICVAEWYRRSMGSASPTVTQPSLFANEEVPRVHQGKR